MASDYAWRIDKDHLSDPGEDYCSQGIVGPRNAAPVETYAHHHQFRMYDDDGELYVTGTLFWNGEADNPSDEATYSPLRDYGMGGLGCTLIKYTDRPYWDIG